MKKLFFILAAVCLIVACSKDDDNTGGTDSGKTEDPVTPVVEETCRLTQLDSLGWKWEQDAPSDLSSAAYKVSTDKIPLHFFGWSQDEDSVFTVKFPDNTDNYGRAVVAYKMCSVKQGPAAWDMTTQIMIQDPDTQEWYEFTRCITPYGNSFDSSWEKTFYIDVTEFLPLLKNNAKFKIFYCGWDATATRQHACQLTYYLFEGDKKYGTPTFHQKVYDSTLNGNSGYRSWAYGVEGYSIEEDGRLDERTITIPAGTKTAVFRVCFTGHGQDANTGHEGTFPDRKGYSVNNPAEFDLNHITFVLNGDSLKQKGFLYELNGGSNSYYQAGTYSYARCNWGPGKPCNVEHWILKDIPEGGETIKLDLDLDRYISKQEKPNAESVAQFYVEVDVYGFK